MRGGRRGLLEGIGLDWIGLGGGWMDGERGGVI